MKPTHNAFKPTLAQDEAEILTRLERVLGDAVTPPINGKPVASAVFDLFRSEARQRGREVAYEAWRALDSAAILDLAGKFYDLAFRRHGVEVELPGGATMWDYMPGCVWVGDEKLTIDVDRPGLYPVEHLLSAGGSNLERLVSDIERLASKHGVHGFGKPRLVCRMDPGANPYRLQFPPFKPAAGVVLEYNLSYFDWGDVFAALPAARILKLAAKIVVGMRKLQAYADHYSLAVKRIRRVARAAAREMRATKLHAITLELAHLALAYHHFRYKGRVRGVGPKLPTRHSGSRMG